MLSKCAFASFMQVPDTNRKWLREFEMPRTQSDSDKKYAEFVTGPWSTSLDKALFLRVCEKFGKFDNDALVEGCAMCVALVASHRREEENQSLRKELKAAKTEVEMYKTTEEEMAVEILRLRDKCELLRNERDVATDEAEKAKQ